MNHKPFYLFLSAFLLGFAPAAVFADDQSSPGNQNDNQKQTDDPNKQNTGLIDAFAKARARQDPNEDKYGSVAPNLKRIDAAMKDAQGLLSNTELTYFQNKYSALKDNAALEAQTLGSSGTSYLGPMKSLEQELNNSLEQARQNNLQNRQKLDAALAHLRTSFADRKSLLSSSDQLRMTEAISEIETRAASLKSSNDTANRIAGLTEEVANLESNIVGREIFNVNSGTQTNAKQQSSSSSFAEETNGKKAKSNDEDWESIPNSKTPMPVEVKPAISQILEQIDKDIQHLANSGILGTFDQDEFKQRLLILKRNFDALGSGTNKAHAQREAAIRKDLEQLKNDLTERKLGH